MKFRIPFISENKTVTVVYRKLWPTFVKPNLTIPFLSYTFHSDPLGSSRYTGFDRSSPYFITDFFGTLCTTETFEVNVRKVKEFIWFFGGQEVNHLNHNITTVNTFYTHEKWRLIFSTFMQQHTCTTSHRERQRQRQKCLQVCCL